MEERALAITKGDVYSGVLSLQEQRCSDSSAVVAQNSGAMQYSAMLVHLSSDSEEEEAVTTKTKHTELQRSEIESWYGDFPVCDFSSHPSY